MTTHHFLLTALLAAGMVQPAAAQLTKTDEMKNNLTVEVADSAAWRYGGTINLGINQGFLHNWAAGGEVVSFTINGVCNLNASRLKQNTIWANNLDMSYGLFYALSNAFIPRKLDDRIDFTSRYGVRIRQGKPLYAAALVNFRSQFTEGYDYSQEGWRKMPTSRFLSPAYITAALGLEYHEGTRVSLFLSPAAARITMADRQFTTRRPQGDFGVPYGETHRYELGAYASFRFFTSNAKKTLSYQTRLDLYSNYLAKDTKDDAGMVEKRDNPGNIDILWDNTVSLKTSERFGVILTLTAIYDNDLPYDYKKPAPGQQDDPGKGLGWVQLKQNLSFGFTYKL